METDERPSKLRKLDSHDGSLSESASDKPLLPAVEVNGALVPTATNADSRNPDEHSGAEIPNGDNSEDESDGGVDIDDQQPRPNTDQAEQNGESASEPSQPMSKNQLKKLRKKQEWEAGREYRKLKRKQKLQEKKARKRAAKEEDTAQTGSAAQEQQQPQDGQIQQPLQQGPTTASNSKPRPRRPIQLPVTIIIDCGFDELMMEKERISLGSQLTRSYSDNSRAPFHAHLVISSWGGLLKERFDTILNKHYLNWKGVTFTEDDFVAAAKRAKEVMKGPRGGKLLGALEKFAKADPAKPGVQRHADPDRAPEDAVPSAPTDSPTPRDAASSAPSIDQTAQDERQIGPETNDTPASPNPESAQKDQPAMASTSDSHPATAGEVVYLTSDSPYTLTELSPYSTYIVGGLVDKNRHKGICYKIAREKGVKTAKLPIGEYMEMQSRKVLATNHVVEIMVRWLECGDWGEAFLKVIPKRKGGKLKGDVGKGNSESVTGDDEHDDDEKEADEIDNGTTGQEEQSHSVS